MPFWGSSLITSVGRSYTLSSLGVGEVLAGALRSSTWYVGEEEEDDVASNVSEMEGERGESDECTGLMGDRSSS